MPYPTTIGVGLMSYPSTVDSGQVAPWTTTQPELIQGATSSTLAANIVYCYVFELYGTATYSGMKIKTGSTASGTVDCGIYDSGGNLLVHCSSPSSLTASAVNTISFSANITLNPGRYIMALTPSSSSDTYFRTGSINAGMERAYTATNGGSAGVLPNTTGTLNTTTSCAVMSLVVVGGAP